MIARWVPLLWAAPAIFLMAFSVSAWAGAGGMGQTGQDVCALINDAYQVDLLPPPFGNPAAIAAAQAADVDLPASSPCDPGSYPLLMVNGVNVLDSFGFPILIIPDTAPDNDCAAFNALDAGSCVVALVPEPARFPLAALIIGSMGIIGFRTYRTRASRDRV